MAKRTAVHFDNELFLYGETYYYRGTPLGLKKRVEHSLSLKKGSAQKDVLKAKKDLLEILSRGGSAGGKNSFDGIALKYIDEREKEAENPDHLSERSLYETKSIMTIHLIPFFSSKRIEEIDQSLFDDYCFLKKKKKLNLVNHRKVMNHFMKWCVRRNYLRYRPELEIPKSAKKPRREREVLTNDEIVSLLKAAEGKVLLYVGMYLLMGMRNMEICKLKWSEIDFEKRSIFINPLNNRRRKMRVIPINSNVLRLLSEWKYKVTGDWVFPSRTPNGKKPYMDPSGGIRKAWANAVKASGIKKHITPHDLRATFETHMHVNPEFTDSQREKMAGAKIDVQKDIYVKMQVEHIRGLEKSVNVPGLDKVLKSKVGGNGGGKAPRKKA